MTCRESSLVYGASFPISERLTPSVAAKYGSSSPSWDPISETVFFRINLKTSTFNVWLFFILFIRSMVSLYFFLAIITHWNVCCVSCVRCECHFFFVIHSLRKFLTKCSGINDLYTVSISHTVISIYQVQRKEV